jgi:ribose 5-phosphate isomerase
MSKLKKVDLPIEICEFLKVPVGTQMTPLAIGMKFLQYVAKNSTQEKGKIFVDENLRRVIKDADTPEFITYAEFQKIMLKLYDTTGEITPM